MKNMTLLPITIGALLVSLLLGRAADQKMPTVSKAGSQMVSSPSAQGGVNETKVCGVRTNTAPAAVPVQDVSTTGTNDPARPAAPTGLRVVSLAP
jgi:hypothetical protein